MRLIIKAFFWIIHDDNKRSLAKLQNHEVQPN